MWRFLRVFKPAHCKVADFRRGRTRQPDDEFLADCGVAPGTEPARIALAVRRAVAATGLVDPLFVRAQDSYPGSLEVLPLWDSMDWVALQFEIERELGQPVRWQAGQIVPQSGPLTVSGMVTGVRDLLVQQPTAEQAATADRPRG
jgi:hypothetical protein